MADFPFEPKKKPEKIAMPPSNTRTGSWCERWKHRTAYAIMVHAIDRFLEIRNQQSMKCSLSPQRCLVLFLGLAFMGASVFAQGERILTPPQRQKPINLDKELEEPVKQDRAASYYHFSLSKLYENSGDMPRALSEMENALKYNKDSPGVHLEMAALLEKTGNTLAAIEHAEEAARLDPQDPDPHWLLANLYFHPQQRGGQAGDMQKAIGELEKLKELTPGDERLYFALGGAYFAFGQPEKGIEYYEKFQSISTSTDNGYRAIAKYFDEIGNEEKAIEYLNKGLKVQPDSTDSLFMLGTIYSKLNKSKDAIQAYKRLLGLTGNNPNVSFRLAAALLDANEYGDALKIIDELSKSVPADATILALRGRAQFGLRKFPEAIKTFQSVLEMDPAAMETRFYLGRIYEETSRFPEAAKIFSDLLEKPMGNPEEARNNRFVFQQHLAADYMEMGNHEKAVAICQDMAKADPKRGNPQLLNAYRMSKQFDQALAFGKQQYEKDPTDIDMTLIYARTLADAGKLKEGAEVLSKLLESNPDNIDVYVNLSQVYIQDKHYTDAEKILRRAEDKSKDSENNERLKIQLATVYEKQKEFDRAESVLKEVLKFNPQSAVALNYIGYMLADRGVRLEEALKYVQEALAIEPQRGAYIDSLGWAFFKMNDLANAEKYLLEADELVKDDPTIDEHLGDLYFKTGDLQKAQEFWTRSIKLGTEQEDIQKVRQKLDALQKTIRKQKTAK
jgi:tetratricopeptide (TPR) repeat protein